MKKFIGGLIPFLTIHFICCGSLLVLLISSGYLLKLSNESQNKFLLVPALLLLIYIWRQLQKDKECGHPRSLGEKLCRLLLIMIIYLITSYLFIVYLFIPWWIPGYEGGALLP